MTNKTITEVFRKVKAMKHREGYTVKPSTVVMEYEELNNKGEVIKVRPVTWREVKKLVKRLK